jgi:hypothetical protein
MSRGHFVLKPRRDELARKDESAAEHCPMTADGSIGLCPTLCSSSGPTTALPAARTEQDSRPEMGAAPVFAKRRASACFASASAGASLPADLVPAPDETQASALGLPSLARASNPGVGPQSAARPFARSSASACSLLLSPSSFMARRTSGALVNWMSR